MSLSLYEIKYYDGECVCVSYSLSCSRGRVPAVRAMSRTGFQTHCKRRTWRRLRRTRCALSRKGSRLRVDWQESHLSGLEKLYREKEILQSNTTNLHCMINCNITQFTLLNIWKMRISFCSTGERWYH